MDSSSFSLLGFAGVFRELAAEFLIALSSRTIVDVVRRVGIGGWSSSSISSIWAELLVRRLNVEENLDIGALPGREVC